MKGLPPICGPVLLLIRLPCCAPMPSQRIRSIWRNGSGYMKVCVVPE